MTGLDLIASYVGVTCQWALPDAWTRWCDRLRPDSPLYVDVTCQWAIPDALTRLIDFWCLYRSLDDPEQQWDRVGADDADFLIMKADEKVG